MKENNERVSKKGKFNIRLIIILAIVVVVVAAAVMFFVLNGNQEAKLSKDLKEIAAVFYEDFYYAQVAGNNDQKTVSDFLGKYTTTGVKINLENLGRYESGKYKDKIKEFKNAKTNKDCDLNNTMAVIYPKEPYGKTNYTIETVLDCGFAKK